MKAIWLVFLLSGTASAGTFEPPQGCTGFLTVQSRGCKVSNHYTCTADAPGDQTRVDFGAEGAYFVSRIDYEAQWVASVELPTGIEQILLPEAADPASFSELLASGRDDYDFGLSRSDGSTSRVTGYDRLTGRRVVIDGIPLQQTEFAMTETAPDGTITHRARGFEYVHPAWRLFFSGPSEWDPGDGFLPIDHSPITFSQPGEAGFMETEPKYECDMLMSSWTGAALTERAMAAGVPNGLSGISRNRDNQIDRKADTFADRTTHRIEAAFMPSITLSASPEE
ncbi:MAG: hypothetical protein Q7J57_16840 [Gemmobacter sp.]|nr:hypothetical protein [Gemmobacter sp.]